MSSENGMPATRVHDVVLLPCPFCGCDAYIHQGFDVDCESTTATIYCKGCDACFGPEYPDDVQDVIDFMGRWNNRVHDEALEEYLAWKREFGQ